MAKIQCVSSLRRQQRGVTLMIALIMLIVMTMYALSSFNFGDMNMKLIANAQERQRVRDVTERWLNDRLYAINAELESDPCDESVLTANDGGSEHLLEGVKILPVRTFINATCVPNQTVKDDWLEALEDEREADETKEAACADAESDACKAAEAALEQAQKDARRADRRMLECVRKGQQNSGLAVLDPALEGGAGEGGDGEADGGGDDEAGGGAGGAASSENLDGNSYCVDAVMEVRATGRDMTSNASVTIVRGVAVSCSNHDISGC